ncbi:MAG: methyltransferase [Caldilineaceae bacterium]
MRLNPGHLITDSFFALSRNPNYFSEMLIYLGFGLLAMHWLPVAILALWIAAYWWPSMLRKDRSLARYQATQPTPHEQALHPSCLEHDETRVVWR